MTTGIFKPWDEAYVSEANAKGKDTFTADQSALVSLKLATTHAPRGVFGRHPASTPKYVKQLPAAFREPDFRESMARMFIQVSSRSEYEAFWRSVDAVEDQSSSALARIIAGTSLGIGAEKGGGAGYIDFLLQQAQHNLQEKMEVVELLADNYVVYYFGTQAPVFSYGGQLINTKEDDQAANMFRLYRDMIRGTQLARRKKLVALRYDSFIIRGTTSGLGWTLLSENEMVCPFNFSFLVKQIIVLPNPDMCITPLSEAVVSEKGTLAELSTAVTQTRTRPRRVVAIPAEMPAEGVRARAEKQAAADGGTTK